MLNSSFSQQERKKWQPNFAISSGKYLITLVLVITATSLNCFYSIAMMFLTAFTLAYLTKGSRCK
jgi:predicted PurR-regulated permease PerM